MNILDPFMQYDESGSRRLKLEELHQGTECMRILSETLEGKKHRKLVVRLKAAYHRAHLVNCGGDLAANRFRFRGQGW